MYICRKGLLFLFVIVFFGTNFLCEAQLFEGLKDAVLNAEGLLGDIFQSLDSVAKHFKFSKETWEDSVEEECIYTCPDGLTPKRNKYHKPVSNGCGVPGMQITSSEDHSQYMPVNEMTRCCDQHDFCYSTCNKDKDECDLAFKKCLYRICDNSKGKVPDTVMTGCKTAAKVLYSGTTMFGCKFYKESQKEACYCPPPRKIPTADEL